MPIWQPRCDEIARLEQIIGIQKQDLKRKRKQELNEEEDITRDRLIGSITDGINIEYIWDLTTKTF
ncbi:hypothetical protein RhiirB3_460816 [Rhizophagus irregularis]|nr:hypothetical protein RhiirB3_460816 [Rhizophagus irregularis]